MHPKTRNEITTIQLKVFL